MGDALKVSYLMTVYNDDKHIRESISSVLNQTYNDIELVIVNDGSTDNSSEIIKEFHDNRIIFLNRKENKGRSYSLNEGLKKCTGELIFINDSDDYSTKDRTEKILKYYNNNNLNIGVICGSSLSIKEGHERKILFKQGLLIGKNNGKIFKHKLYIQNPIVHSSVAYTRKALEEIGGFPTEITSGIDYLAYLKIIQKYEIHGIPDIVCKRNIHSNNYFLVNEKILKDMNKNEKIRRKWMTDNIKFANIYLIIYDSLTLLYNVLKRKEK